MEYGYYENKKYGKIPLLRMVDNRNGNSLFFIRKYSTKDITTSIHRHEYMQINYICQGSGEHFINNHEFGIIQGDIFVVPPYVPHHIIACPETDIDIFEFEFVPGFINQSFSSIRDKNDFICIESAEPFIDFAYIEPFLVSEAHIKPRLNLTGKTRMAVEKILNEALTEYINKESGYVLLVKSLLLELLVIVGREYKEILNNSEPQSMLMRHRDSISDAVRYINEHYMEELNANDIAHKFMLSPSYFRYLFKSITSKTFTEYLNGVRVLKAVEMLKTTDKRVVDISRVTGFNNTNNFNKVFRQQTGVAPLQYRKRGIS